MSLRAASHLLAVGLVTLGADRSAFAQETGDSVTRTGRVSEDLYAAGGQVTIAADVDGDVIVAGGRVVVDQRVTGDVMAAGGFLELRADVQDDVRAAGGFITISGSIAGDVIAAGGTVSLSRSAEVRGRAWLTGGRVEIDGRLDRGLRAAGGSVSIAGEINGDVDLFADKITVLPTARIRGDIRYSGRHEPTIDTGAQITGQVSYEPFESGVTARTPAAAWGARIAIVVSLMLTGVVLFLMFPSFAGGAAQAIASDAWKCLGLGLAVLIIGPIVALLLLVTIIGIPLAIIALAAYVVFLIAGYLIAALFLGELGLRWTGQDRQAPTSLRALSIVSAVLVLSIIRWIPLMGALTTLVALVFGLGALKLQAIRLYSTGHSPGRAKTVRRRRSS